MTALDKYRKLEGMGLWAARAGAQRREVIVGFGDATLVISDGRSQQVLSHWSLPAVRRQNPGARPARYSPDGDADEVLELDDDWLIDALDTLQRALQPPVRLRARALRAAAAALAAAAVAALMLLGPGALQRQTAAALPDAARSRIGAAVLEQMRTAPDIETCTSAQGTAALRALARQVLAPPARVTVLRGLAPAQLRALPGGGLVVDARVLDTAGGPAALAGALVLAQARTAGRDPLLPALAHAGLWATLRLLATGRLPDGALDGYAARLMRAPPAPLQLQAALDGFARVALSTGPVTDTPALMGPAPAALRDGLRAGDPRPGPAPALLSDGQWVALQNICNF